MMMQLSGIPQCRLLRAPFLEGGFGLYDINSIFGFPAKKAKSPSIAIAAAGALGSSA